MDFVLCADLVDGVIDSVEHCVYCGLCMHIALVLFSLLWFSCLLLIAYLGWGVVLLLAWVIVFRFVCLVLICCA